MNTHNQSCIPVELRIALYRRAVAALIKLPANNTVSY